MMLVCGLMLACAGCGATSSDSEKPDLQSEVSTETTTESSGTPYSLFTATKEASGIGW